MERNGGLTLFKRKGVEDLIREMKFLVSATQKESA
jgi:hypothetical protein